MQKILLGLTLCLGGAIAATTTANAQQQNNCADRNVIVERLQAKYGETRQSMGLGRNNGVVEVYASSETGTWTIFMSLPDGRACLIAAGEYFENVSEALPNFAEDDA